MALTTRTNVKAFKNISASDHDAEIDRLIPVVDQFIAQYCNRATLEQATVTEYHSTRSGQTTLRLKQYPAASITSLYDDPDRAYGSDTLLSTSDYVIEDDNAGIVRLDGATFSEGIKNVKVIYVAGYASGSNALKLLEQAAIELIWLARDKGDKALLGLSSRSIADGRMDTFNTDWPAGVKDILDQFRKADH